MSSGTSRLSVSLSELRAGAGPAHPEGGNQHQTYTTTAATRHACPGARDGALPFGSCALPLLTLRSLPVALGYHQTLSKYTDSAPSFSGWAPVPHGESAPPSAKAAATPPMRWRVLEGSL